MVRDEFFEAPEDQSIIKTTIVTNYFDMWTRVMLPRIRHSGNRLAYIDLFSGPGRYADGSPSTPLWVLEYALRDPKLCASLITMFNDKNPEYARQLREAIANLPGIEKLAHPPQVTNFEVSRDLVNLLRSSPLVPTLFFIDPFGYKGLSLDLIGSAIRSWGCDCIFFFNYNRINPAISNLGVVERMNDLFGAKRAERLREQVSDLTPEGRQAAIISELTEALKEVGGKHVLPFEFQSQHGDRPSHYIVFVSKAFLGYHLMKEVMWPLSTDTSEVRSFEYVPVKSTQMSLFPDFGKTHSIPLLKDVLVRTAAGQTMSVWNVYEQFTVDTPYMLKHVKEALRQLEDEKLITIEPSAEKRRKIKGVVTLANTCVVTFPS